MAIRKALHSNIKVVQHLSAAAYTTTQTPANGVDMEGFNSIEFVLSVGVVTNIANSPQPSWAFKLQESDSQSSGFTDVVTVADTVSGSSASPATSPNTSTGVFLTVDDSAEDDAVYRIGYIGNKRYVRCVGTAANTPGSTPISITAVLGHAALAPTSDG